MQMEMRVFGEAGGVELIDTDLIRRLPDPHQALLVQINRSGRTDESICHELDIDPGHFSRMRSRKAHFNTAKLADLQSICRNAALAQYLAYQAGYSLIARDQLRERAERAEARLRALGEAV